MKETHLLRRKDGAIPTDSLLHVQGLPDRVSASAIHPSDAIECMPDVGLFTAAKPLDSDLKVVIKFAVEVEGLPVYQESYDVKTLERELKKDPERFAAIWLRRVKCVTHCRKRPGFSACLTRCLMDGQCGDLGHENAETLDGAGEEQ